MSRCIARLLLAIGPNPNNISNTAPAVILEETKKRNKSVSQGDGFSQGNEVPGRGALSLQLPVYSRALNTEHELIEIQALWRRYDRSAWAISL